MIAALIIFSALVLLDILTTVRMLKVPGVYERNPIIRELMKHGKVWLVFKVAASAALIGIMLAYPSAVNIYAIWALCALYAVVVVNNYRLGS